MHLIALSFVHEERSFITTLSGHCSLASIRGNFGGFDWIQLILDQVHYSHIIRDFQFDVAAAHIVWKTVTFTDWNELAEWDNVQYAYFK